MDQELILRYLVFVGIKEPNDDVVIKNTLSELRWHQDDIEIAISILRGGEIIRDRNSYRSFNPNRTNLTFHPQPETTNALLGFDIEIPINDNITYREKTKRILVREVSSVLAVGLFAIGVFWWCYHLFKLNIN